MAQQWHCCGALYKIYYKYANKLKLLSRLTENKLKEKHQHENKCFRWGDLDPVKSLELYWLDERCNFELIAVKPIHAWMLPLTEGQLFVLFFFFLNNRGDFKDIWFCNMEVLFICLVADNFQFVTYKKRQTLIQVFLLHNDRNESWFV